METWTYETNNCWRYLFKSYYVVWKLSIDTEKEYEYDEFKSYYVVWKLSETNF